MDRRYKLTGLAAVLVVFALSRWGTYLHAGPLFICDVLLTLAIANHLAGRVYYAPAAASRGAAGLLLPLTLTWAALRLAVGGDYTMIALRDAVPYLYAGVGIFAAWAYIATAADRRRRAGRLLRWALLVHLMWVAAAHFLEVAGPALSGTAYVLQIRPDIDAALLAILAGLSLHDVLGGRPKWLNLLVLAACCLLVLQLPNRSGLLSLVGVFGLVVFVHMSSRGRSSNAKVGFVVVLPIAAAACAVLLPLTEPGVRLLTGLGLYEPTVGSLDAVGTTQARILAWSALVDYWTETTSRFWFGVGFGPDFVTDSGIAAYLGSGTYENVRSPHNYLLGTAVRLGLVGVALVGLLLVTVVRSILRLRKRFDEEPVLMTCGLAVVALVPAALVGVVFEAPFGSIPLFWSAGVLLGAAGREAKLVKPVAPGRLFGEGNVEQSVPAASRDDVAAGR